MKYFDLFQQILDEAPRVGSVSLITYSKGGKELPKHIEDYMYRNSEEVVVIFNHDTNRLSTKTLKENTKGKFFNVSHGYRGSKRYHLNDFKS